MSDQYLGEIRRFGFNFAPVQWALCDGQILPISQYTALFSLLGTMYGGNGQTTFALPDLQSRVPMSFGNGRDGTPYTQGEVGGVEQVTLDIAEMPAHNHAFFGTGTFADSKLPVTGSAYARTTTPEPVSPGDNFYAVPGGLTAINPNTLVALVGGQPHGNVQPYLTINWCIALEGIFPARN